MSLFISSTDTAWKVTVKKNMQLGSLLKHTVQVIYWSCVTEWVLSSTVGEMTT